MDVDVFVPLRNGNSSPETLRTLGRPSFALGASNATAVVEICRRLHATGLAMSFDRIAGYTLAELDRPLAENSH